MSGESWVWIGVKPDIKWKKKIKVSECSFFTFLSLYELMDNHWSFGGKMGGERIGT